MKTILAFILCTTLHAATWERWDAAHPVRWRIDAGVPKEAEAPIRAAVALWQAALVGRLTLVEDKTALLPEIVFQYDKTGKKMGFSTAPAECVQWNLPKRQSEIKINGALFFRRAIKPQQTAYMLHELGHALGLSEHSRVYTAVMGVIDHVPLPAKLHGEDVQRIQALYNLREK